MMADIDQVIETRIRSFLDELNDLVRQSAIAAVADALGGARVDRPRPAPAPARAPARAPAAPAQGKVTPSSSRKKGEKRPPAELARVRELLAAHVKDHPGQGIEAIGRALGLPTADLTRPMNKLLAAGRVRKQGDRRATKYFPGGGKPAGRPAAKSSTKKSRK